MSTLEPGSGPATTYPLPDEATTSSRRSVGDRVPAGPSTHRDGRDRDGQDRRGPDAAARALLDAFDDAAFLLDTLSGELIDLNRAAAQCCGRSRQALLQRGLAAAPAIEERLRRTISTAPSGTWQRLGTPVHDTQGEERWFEIRAHPLELDGRPCTAVQMRDVTSRIASDLSERRRAQDEVRAARDLLRSSLTSMVQGIAVFDEHGRVKVHNERMLELLELPREVFGSFDSMVDLARYQIERGDFAEADAAVGEQVMAYAQGRIGLADMDMAASHTRRTPNGRYLQIQTARTPSGDFVRTYSDVTDYVMLNRQLDAVLADYGKLRRHEATRTQRQLLAALAELAKHRDNETGRHIERTKRYVQTLADALAHSGRCREPLGDERIARIVESAPMHDLGKIGVPDHILRKPARLTPEEMAVMRTHAAIGESVLRIAARGSMREMSALLEVAARIAGGHHEHWDGSGYPRGLAGEAIPLEARLMALADLYDALTTARVYKPAWTHAAAVAEIRRLRGSRLDPLVVEMFEQRIDTFREIAESLADAPGAG